MPGARSHFADVHKDRDPHVRRRVMQGNAAELYRIPMA
jgi:hypothetical protein